MKGGFEIDIVKTVQMDGLPTIPYAAIAQSVLGKDYDLTLTICGDKLAQRMNVQYRKKTYKPNVLSFPYDKKTGEIFLNVRCAQREAKKGGVSLRNRIGLLFVHACWHLMGHDHGVTMERREHSTLRTFKLLSD